MACVTAQRVSYSSANGGIATRMFVRSYVGR